MENNIEPNDQQCVADKSVKSIFIGTRVSQEVYDKVVQKAKEQDRTISWLLRQAIESL